ncbi:MAG: nucleotide pyrophosphohydrolase [Flaviflexus sp.]|uniref:nucleotide pyrophosphohydrolase n=1 Tax=Flaviflexus sp. TaxID=1969482 RepID=UPI003F933A59
MEIQELVDEINQFRDERNWRQFHNAKDLALSISLEASELLELFQWKSADDVVSGSQQELAEELADVLIYCLMLADDLDFDPGTIIRQKLETNRQKYTIEESYGSSEKYNSTE